MRKTRLRICRCHAIASTFFGTWRSREGKRANIIGVPPGFPPRKVNGISVGCFLTPDTATNDYTHPASVKETLLPML